MNRIWLAALIMVFAIFLCSCRKDERATSVSVEKIKVIGNLDLPECMVIDPATGDVYVSNVVTASEGYWDDDANGFISKMSADGTVLKLRWLEGTADMPINGPKGMCILAGKLYINDNNKLKRCSLGEPGNVELIEIAGAEKLNDLATDGEFIWASDTARGKVLRIAPDGSVSEIPAPEAVNGIALYNGKIFVVSWGLHEVYQLDPAGQKEPIAFGLAEKFVALDCIEVLDDGSFVVSDYKGNMLYRILPDRKTVIELMELQSPADFAFDRENKLLYVPEMLKNRAVILKLK